MKKLILGISGGVSFLIFLVLLTVTGYLGNSQQTQRMAERWSEKDDVAQVSCFFSVDASITEDRIQEFEHSIDNALADASVVQESENPSARLWVDAYSADGKISLASDRGSVDADAIGIGGDFFLFHPLRLVSGAYFSGNDLMQDYCIIDEDAAWQLFGSSNVAGMTVYIGRVPHIVTGVVERPKGRLAEGAGLDSTLVYVSMGTLEELGSSNGINHYEIVMPNPVTHFAYNYVKEQLGMEEKETEVVENTSRYSFVSRCKMILQFGLRSMNGKAIIYPYWENIARGYEDILAVLTLVELIFLLYAIGVALGFFILWWRHKGWTIKDVCLKGKDKVERRMELARARRKAKHGDTEDLEFLSEFDDREPGAKLLGRIAQRLGQRDPEKAEQKARKQEEKKARREAARGQKAEQKARKQEEKKARREAARGQKAEQEATQEAGQEVRKKARKAAGKK